MAEGSVQKQVEAQFKSLVEPKHGIDQSFLKHYILLQDHGSLASAADTACSKKRPKEARLYVQNPHRTATVKELSISHQLLLQHLLTLLCKVRLHVMPVVLVPVLAHSAHTLS
jgi:hypothetical protein